MKSMLTALWAPTFVLAVSVVAGGCSGSALVALDGGGSGTNSDSGSSSSGTDGSGSSSGVPGSGSSSGAGSAGDSSGASGGGSGTPGSGHGSGAPSSGVSSGGPGSGSSAGAPGSGRSSGASSSGHSSGAPASGSSSGGSSGSGGLDCNGSKCAPGDLCCPGFDAYCTPTCMKVNSCPAFGHACRVREDAGPPVDSGGLRWYRTCGWPVCPAPVGPAQPACGVGPLPPCPLTDDAGAPCPAVGSSCSTKGDTCGRPSFLDCGSIEVCDDHDPTGGPGGCPMSSAKFKNDIHYVDENQLERLHDETMQVRLATYNYKGQYGDPDGTSPTLPGRGRNDGVKHLGSIIEDNPQSFAVDRGHDRVDIYGYLSMVVAAMQVQEKQIADLRKQLVDGRSNVCGAGQSR